MLKKAQVSGDMVLYVWLGGSDAAEEGVWSWSDGAGWAFEDWLPGNPNYKYEVPEPSNKTGEDCLKMHIEGGVWFDERCSTRIRPLCHRDTHVFKGKLNRTWTFPPAQVPKEIEFVWESDTAFTPFKRTGLSISWRIVDEDGSKSTFNPVYETENRFLIGTTNLVHDLKKLGASETEIWTDTIAYKMSALSQNFEGNCEKSQLKATRQSKLIQIFSQETTKLVSSISYEPRPTNEISDEDLVFGFQIYFFLTYCHESFSSLYATHLDNTDLETESEGLKLFIFYSDTIDMMTPPNMLQTFVNVISSKEVAYDKNLKGVEKMLEELINVLEPSFDYILSHIFTESQLALLANSSRMAFLRNQSTEEKGEEKIVLGENVFLSGDFGNMAVLGNHPVHMTSAESLSAFIPFCAFDGQPDGTQIGNFSVPFCRSFSPTITDGQLCYALNMTKVGFIKEALFFIDPNLERSVHLSHTSEQNSKNSPLKLKQGLGEKSQLAQMHIDTLEPFTSETFASYALTSLKKMTSTENFDEMSDQDKGCRMESRRDCERNILVEKVAKDCQCVPFSLWEAWPNSSNNNQVGLTIVQSRQKART